MPVKLICSKLFFVQLFSRTTFNSRSRQQKTIVNVIELIENVLAEKENLTGVSLLIDIGFSRFL